MNNQIEFTFKTTPEDFIRELIDKVDKKVRKFHKNNFLTPEIIYLDWYTFRKFEIANMKCYSQFNTFGTGKFEIIGLKVMSIPINFDFLELGYEEHGDNVDLGMYIKNMEE